MDATARDCCKAANQTGLTAASFATSRSSGVSDGRAAMVQKLRRELPREPVREIGRDSKLAGLAQDGVSLSGFSVRATGEPSNSSAWLCQTLLQWANVEATVFSVAEPLARCWCLDVEERLRWGPQPPTPGFKRSSLQFFRVAPDRRPFLLFSFSGSRLPAFFRVPPVPLLLDTARPSEQTSGSKGSCGTEAVSSQSLSEAGTSSPSSASPSTLPLDACMRWKHVGPCSSSSARVNSA